MSGPPGSGKTTLARAMPSILPEMSVAVALEVTKVYSVRGLLPHDTPLLRERPFRSPHHGTSSVGLIGGGSRPRPVDVSLAHQGVLFLVELPEFSASTLEMLRQPLEDRVASVARTSGTVAFPANFTLIAAMKPSLSWRAKTDPPFPRYSMPDTWQYACVANLIPRRTIIGDKPA